MICNLIVSEQERASVFAFLFYKRNKKTCSSCIVELYKHLGFFKNTREVPEALACGSCFSSPSIVFLKIPACLIYNSTMHSARFLFLYYKDKDKISHLVTGVCMYSILPGLVNHLMNFLRIFVLRLNVTVPLITLVNIRRARKV